MIVIYIKTTSVLLLVYITINSYAVEEYNISDIDIIGQGKLEYQWLIQYIMEKTLSLEIDYLETIINTYIEVSTKEGVNSDVAIAQMLYHTQCLAFSSHLSKDYNNFASIGGEDISVWTLHKFSTIEAGVYAHVQHLKSYASEETIASSRLDPRLEILKQKKLIGSAKKLLDLSNKWSENPYYGKYIFNVLKKMYFYASISSTVKK